MVDELSWRATSLDVADDGLIQHLFVECFGHAISPSLWAWKYQMGQSTHSGVWLGQTLVAHYGGITRRVRLWGQRALAFQGCDVMVHPSQRGRFSRQNPLVLATTHAVKTHVGVGTKHKVLYGFPNERHMRAAEKLGLYETVQMLDDVRWAAKSTNTSATCQRLNSAGYAFKLIATYLWWSMAAKCRDRVLLERDYAYLRYRYLDHPSAAAYHMLVVTSADAWLPMGVVVLRDNGEEWLVMDVIGDPALLADNLVAASNYVSQRGGLGCRTWLARDVASAIRETMHTEHAGPPIPVAGQIISPGIQPSALRDQWWIMPGDSDFL